MDSVDAAVTASYSLIAFVLRCLVKAAFKFYLLIPRVWMESIITVFISDESSLVELIDGGVLEIVVHFIGIV